MKFQREKRRFTQPSRFEGLEGRGDTMRTFAYTAFIACTTSKKGFATFLGNRILSGTLILQLCVESHVECRDSFFMSFET